MQKIGDFIQNAVFTIRFCGIQKAQETPGTVREIYIIVSSINGPAWRNKMLYELYILFWGSEYSAGAKAYKNIMPVGYKAQKPKYNFINPETINSQVINAVRDNIIALGYDLTNPKDRKSITHNEVNYILRKVYEQLFKPDQALYNNQKSLLDYDDTKTIKMLADTFIDICAMLNKSLGLVSFGYMIGVSTTTIYNWSRDEKPNPERFAIVKYIQDCHKAAQIGLLNDSPVGALAVANNDTETGLEWSTKQALNQASNAVFLIPSERLNRLKIQAPEEISKEPEED